MCLRVICLQVSLKIVNQTVSDFAVADDNGGEGGRRQGCSKSHRLLDQLANQTIARALYNSKCCCALVSSENKMPLFISRKQAGPYVVAFDPLNGTTNIGCNVSVGTIFGIWKRKSRAEDGMASMVDVLRAGNEMVSGVLGVMVGNYG